MTTDSEAPTAESHLARLRAVTEAIAAGKYGDIDALFDLTIDASASQDVRDLAEAFGSMVRLKTGDKIWTQV